jgi:hypothetical protein
MSVTLVMQAKRDLYFEFWDRSPQLFMKKGDCRVLRGAHTTMIGARYPITHTEKNFNFFVPMTKENAPAALKGSD